MRTRNASYKPCASQPHLGPLCAWSSKGQHGARSETLIWHSSRSQRISLDLPSVDYWNSEWDTMSIGRSSEGSVGTAEMPASPLFRPKTSILARARVLNIEKLEELGLDMALTTKEFLNANSELIMPRRNTIARHLLSVRSDSPLRNDPPRQHQPVTIDHPKVVAPVEPTPQVAIKKDKPKVRRSKSLRQSGSYDNKYKNYRSLTSFVPPVDLGVPKPCTSCSRSDLPERFHSHPPSAHHKKPHAIKTTSNSPTELKESRTKENSLLHRSGSLRKPTVAKSPYRSKTSNSSPGSPISQRRKYSPDQTIWEESEDAHSLQQTTVCPADSLPLAEAAGSSVAMPRTTSAQTGRFLVCYICGRLFGTTSLKIHEPQCLEKWLRENDALPEHLKRPIPRKPEEGQGYNDSAYAVFESTLLSCPQCGRTFLPDRLPVHQKACKGPTTTNKRSKSPPPETAHEETTPSKPRQRIPVLCYICGREFGNASVRIHEPQCLRKWHNENHKLPSHLRRPEPQKPDAVLNEDGKVDREATWEVLWKSHLDQLMACPNCGRKFKPDRLEVHLRSCHEK